MELYGLRRDRIDELFAELDGITVKQANRIVAKYYTAAKPVMVLIGRAAEIGGQVGEYEKNRIVTPISLPGFQPQPPAAAGSSVNR